MTSLRVGRFAGGATLEIRLLPRSSRPGAGGVRDGALELRVSAPPVEGKANDAARKLLARLLGVSPSKIRLQRGARSRNKVFAVEGLSPEDVLERAANIANRA